MGMTRSVCAVLLVAILACPALADPRITFLRRIPPPHSLSPAEDVALISAVGDNESIRTFLDVFLDRTNRGRGLRLNDVSKQTQQFVGQHLDEKTLQRLRRRYKADAYVAINRFTCVTTTRAGEGSTTDYEGNRVKRKHQFIDAICRARIDVLDAQHGESKVSFEVMGEGTSPRVVDITDEERTIALDSAAKYAAINAAEGITPREARETLELDGSAPSFDVAMALIDDGRLRQARAIWESALNQYPASAALLYNLGALSEAMEDLPAARSYFERAAMNSTERRYRAGFEMFRRRNGK
jgi:tetratricopeptide (TPR) repeat protein